MSEITLDIPTLPRFSFKTYKTAYQSVLPLETLSCEAATSLPTSITRNLFPGVNFAFPSPINQRAPSWQTFSSKMSIIEALPTFAFRNSQTKFSSDDEPDSESGSS